MTADDLARSVAADLGQAVEKSTDAAIAGEQTRGWSEAAAVAGFLVEVCRFAWEVYKDTKSKPELLERILQTVKRPSAVTEAKAKEVAATVVDRLTAGAA